MDPCHLRQTNDYSTYKGKTYYFPKSINFACKKKGYFCKCLLCYVKDVEKKKGNLKANRLYGGRVGTW